MSTPRPDQKNLANEIWQVAELLRGDFKRSEFGLVIDPKREFFKQCGLACDASLFELSSACAPKVSP